MAEKPSQAAVELANEIDGYLTSVNKFLSIEIRDHIALLIDQQYKELVKALEWIRDSSFADIQYAHLTAEVALAQHYGDIYEKAKEALSAVKGVDDGDKTKL